jgi:hypothetical protein
MLKPIRLLALAAALSSLGALPVGADASASTPRALTKAHAHPTQHRRHRRRPQLYGITPRMMTMAEHVAVCEEGGDWHFRGEVFDGGIGWTLGNWAHFRRPSWPRFMHDAPPRMQANALFRFVWHYRIAMPDQAGYCAGY